MGKNFLPEAIRSMLSQSSWFGAKGLCHSYGVLFILVSMVLASLLLSYLMFNSCNENCDTRQDIVEHTTNKIYRDLTLSCPDPGSIFILNGNNFERRFSFHAAKVAMEWKNAFERAMYLPYNEFPLIT